MELIITRDESKILFSNLTILYNMHKILLQDLRARHSSIGAIFCKHSAYFKMYSVYVNNFDNACGELERLLMKKKKFRAFCQVHIQKISAPRGTSCDIGRTHKRMPRIRKRICSTI